MRAGLQAAFEEVNAAGGVCGRKLRLLSVDDGYEPEQCVDCTAAMIEKNQVFALAGYVGTPTAKVAEPMARDLKVPLIGLFTGAALLRNPVERYVVNTRASYDQETEALTAHLVSVLHLSRIAIVYQNDSFGLSGLRGVETALQRRGLALAAKGSFERNTVAVKSALARMIEASPEAIVIVAPYKAAAALIREAKSGGLETQFATMSFSGTDHLVADLGELGSDLLMSQVVPSPTADDSELVRRYRAALKRLPSDPRESYVSLEGYVAGRVLIAALERAGANVTRESLLNAIDAMSNLDLKGLTFSFSAANHQGSNAIFLTQVIEGRVQPVP